MSRRYPPEEEYLSHSARKSCPCSRRHHPQRSDRHASKEVGGKPQKPLLTASPHGRCHHRNRESAQALYQRSDQPRRGNLRTLQNSLADRTLLQIDQAEPEAPDLEVLLDLSEDR